MSYFFVVICFMCGHAKPRETDLFYAKGFGNHSRILRTEGMKLNFWYSRLIHAIVQQMFYSICHV